LRRTQLTHLKEAIREIEIAVEILEFKTSYTSVVGSKGAFLTQPVLWAQSFQKFQQLINRDKPSSLHMNAVVVMLD